MHFGLTKIFHINIAARDTEPGGGGGVEGGFKALYGAFGIEPFSVL